MSITPGVSEKEISIKIVGAGLRVRPKRIPYEGVDTEFHPYNSSTK